MKSTLLLVPVQYFLYVCASYKDFTRPFLTSITALMCKSYSEPMTHNEYKLGSAGLSHYKDVVLCSMFDTLQDLEDKLSISGSSLMVAILHLFPVVYKNTGTSLVA